MEILKKTICSYGGKKDARLVEKYPVITKRKRAHQNIPPKLAELDKIVDSSKTQYNNWLTQVKTAWIFGTINPVVGGEKL